MSAVSGFHIVLEEDCSEDAATKLQEAIMQMRGVVSVSPHVTNYVDWAARQKASHEIWGKLFQVFQSEKE